VIQAGRAIHLRVLPPPAVTPEAAGPAAVVPVDADTTPLPLQEPAPARIAAAVALAGRTVRQAGPRLGRRRERGGRLPSSGRWPWLVSRPLPGRSRR
jgi:hypothetical protein